MKPTILYSFWRHETLGDRSLCVHMYGHITYSPTDTVDTIHWLHIGSRVSHCLLPQRKVGVLLERTDRTRWTEKKNLQE